ncbi:hypothetical protein CUMW_264000 [Citrus unshiu]|uniref:Uncharacterized protein n=1 Tax=Citrus sinensis TaxID=2711 RepID=A0A067D995_CITSI|nr:hypothetical protein CISIN_1g032746mg [Citrus sinensis]GAY68425.1 hypothetical protein CUMW_264000 [Citrus unshiu]
MRRRRGMRDIQSFQSLKVCIFLREKRRLWMSMRAIQMKWHTLSFCAEGKQAMRRRRQNLSVELIEGSKFILTMNLMAKVVLQLSMMMMKKAKRNMTELEEDDEEGDVYEDEEGAVKVKGIEGNDARGVRRGQWK